MRSEANRKQVVVRNLGLITPSILIRHEVVSHVKPTCHVITTPIVPLTFHHLKRNKLRYHCFINYVT